MFILTDSKEEKQIKVQINKNVEEWYYTILADMWGISYFHIFLVQV